MEHVMINFQNNDDKSGLNLVNYDLIHSAIVSGGD